MYFFVWSHKEKPIWHFKGWWRARLIGTMKILSKKYIWINLHTSHQEQRVYLCCLWWQARCVDGNDSQRWWASAPREWGSGCLRQLRYPELLWTGQISQPGVLHQLLGKKGKLFTDILTWKTMLNAQWMKTYGWNNCKRCVTEYTHRWRGPNSQFLHQRREPAPTFQ